MSMVQILTSEGLIRNPRALCSLNLTPEDCLRMYELMLLTRFFAERAPVEANKGRMPLYISPKGQEAAEIASAMTLQPQDWIFWYSRSHGAALARGVSLETLWKLFFALPDQEAIKDFLTHNSMLPYVLVGSHLTHASGFAWAHKIIQPPTGQPSCVSIAYFGEGATAQGDFHSALNWASIFRIPTVFVCENNQFAISTTNNRQTATKNFAQKALAYNMPFAYVDGNDPFAVRTAIERATLQARNGNGPTLIEAVTYRMDPHTTAIGEICEVPAEERARVQNNGPLRRFELFLLKEAKEYFGIDWSKEKDDRLRTELVERVRASAERVWSTIESQIKSPDLGKKIVAAGVELQRKPRVQKHDSVQPEARIGPETIPRASFADAIRFALFDTLSQKPNSVILGEDVGQIGSVFRTVALPREFVANHLPKYAHRILRGFLPLQEIFGHQRIIDAPLDEEGLVGHAIGIALAGLRPLVEIQFSGFVFEAFNQIVSELGRLIHRSIGLLDLPVVIRLPFGGGRLIEYHRECEVPYFLNNPGLIIACPSTVQDAYDMLRAAAASDKPVMFFENKELYRLPEMKMDLIRREPDRPIEEFGIRKIRTGERVTVTASGRMTREVLRAAEIIAKQGQGIDVEILDIRVFSPLDVNTLVASVRKTGRLVVVHEEPIFGGSGGEIIAAICESDAFTRLQAPPRRVGPPRTHFPPPPFWKNYIPQPEDIAQAILETVKY